MIMTSLDSADQTFAYKFCIGWVIFIFCHQPKKWVVSEYNYYIISHNSLFLKGSFSNK